jgi:hypothetical protein
LRLRQDVDGVFSFVVPPGTQRIRVLPTDSRRFQAAMTLFDPAGKVVQTTQTASVDSGGFGSFNSELAGHFTGLELAAPAAGDTVVVASALEGKATIELLVDAPAATTVAVAADAAIARWLDGQARHVVFTVSVPSSRPAALVALPGDWAYELRLPYHVAETMPNVTGDASYVPVALWSGTETLPLTLR